jgi:sensor histidine kinase YesM
MEKETISHYLELQALRFEGKFDYNIEISPDIDLEHHLIPPMLAQPFIENAIEHGIIHLSSRGRVDIRILLTPPFITLEVEDNGVGIEKSTEFGAIRREKHNSLATRITKDRLRNLRKVYGNSIKMQTIDLTKIASKSQRGTLVRFQVPITIK